MPRCQGCRFNLPASVATCPACGTSLLAPDLRPAGEPGLDAGSLAPAMASGPRIQTGSEFVEAYAAAAPGAVLELDAGEFRLPVALKIDKAITLNGVGMDRTTISCMARDYVLQVVGGGLVSLRGLTVAHVGKSPADVVLVTAADVQLDDVRITGGFTAEQGYAARGTDRHGRGLVLKREASCVARGCRFERNVRDGVALFDDASAALAGGSLAANQDAGARALGRSHLALDDVAASANYLAQVVLGEDARGVLRRVRLTRGGGFGALVMQRARAAIGGCAFDENTRSGLAVWHEAQATVADTSCSRNREHGLDARESAVVEVEGLVACDNHGHGVAFADKASGSGRGVQATGNGLGDTRYYDGARARWF